MNHLDLQRQRFFTRPPVAEWLVNLMADAAAPTLADLGSGAGALTSAARRRWTPRQTLTIDLAETAAAPPDGLPDGRRRHLTVDLCAWPLPPDLVGSFDIVLSNPPFADAAWHQGLAGVFAGAGLPVPPVQNGWLGQAAIFLAQALRLLRSGGQAGLILPDSIISGRHFKDLRAGLLQAYRIDHVVQLPSNAFERTEVHAFLLILSKRPPAAGLRVSRLGPDFNLGAGIAIALQSAVERMDFAFHSARLALPDHATTLACLGAEITRGSLTSSAARASPFATFHTTDFPAGQDTVLLAAPAPADFPARLIVALPGDLLVARIGKQISDKIVMLREGRAAPTDCVFRIRLPEAHRVKALAALRSSAGADYLESVIRGVGPRMLTKDDLLRCPI